jgi:DNA invertase Pin-like site-specific DNA recombinase
VLRYALYARKSDDDTKVTEKSIGEQVAVLLGMAQTQGLPVVATYEESSSAKTPGKRPLFTRLLRQIEHGEVNALLCWHVNRLARNMEEGGKLA